MYFNRFQGNRVHLGRKKAKIWPNISENGPESHEISILHFAAQKKHPKWL